MTESILLAVVVLMRILSNPFANVFQKKLAMHQHPLAVNFLTYLLLSIVCLMGCLFLSIPHLNSNFWLYSLLGGIAGALGNGLLVMALQRGDLSVLGPINAYKSVIGVVASIFLLGEVPGAQEILGIVVIIGGSYFVLNSTKGSFSLVVFSSPSIQYRIWAMALTAIEAVFVKKVIQASTASLAFVSWCVFGAIFSGLLLLLFKVPIASFRGKQLAAKYYGYLGLVVCIGVMQMATNYTFQRMPVGYALALFQLSAIVSVLLGYRVFKEHNIRRKLLGAAMMIAGAILILL